MAPVHRRAEIVSPNAPLAYAQGHTFVDVSTPDGKTWYLRTAERLRRERYTDPETQGWIDHGKG